MFLNLYPAGSGNRRKGVDAMKVSQNPGCGPPETEDGLKSNFTNAPIPDYMQQKEAEKQKLYASGIPMIPDMSVPQWLFVHFLLWIPIVGLVMRIIWAVGTVGAGKDALVNFSRASLIWMAIEAGISILLMIALYSLLGSAIVLFSNT